MFASSLMLGTILYGMPICELVQAPVVDQWLRPPPVPGPSAQHGLFHVLAPFAVLRSRSSGLLSLTVTTALLLG